MKTIIIAVLIVAVAKVAVADGDYSGDKRCPPPTDWSDYSEPYFPREHPTEFPTFYKADRPGWSCSYQREDGVIVQYGDSRTPQEQWLFLYGGNSGDNSD